MPQLGCKKPRVSEALKGRTPPNKGVTTGKPAWNRGVPATPEAREKNSQANRGRVPWNKGMKSEKTPRVYVNSEGRKAAVARYAARLRERDPLGLMNREKRARWQAKKRGIYAEPVDYRLILERDGWTCGICGGQVVADDLSFDHRIPFCEDGEHIAENLQVAHVACNSRKGVAEKRRLRERGAPSL